MASSDACNGVPRIRFLDGNGKRQNISLAGYSRNKVKEIRVHVNALEGALKHGERTPRATTQWVKDLEPKLKRKLAKAGLVSSDGSTTLGPFLDSYVESRLDVKPATVRKWRCTIGHLVEHFRSDRELHSINVGHADAFRLFLYRQNHSENTVRKYCGIAKQFFRAALRKQLIDSNPFADQVTTVTGSPEKYYFLSRDDAAKIDKACPDLQWRMIFALCRFGGLRCPSEVLALRWEDIDWKQRRFTVHSSKTEHHEGKGTRRLPLFPELESVLSDGFEAAEEGETRVITRYRDSTQNLRTTFRKIIIRAGLQPWPKPLQNLRSTRETELVEDHPLHAVTAWIGNSQLVAAKHYLQVTEEHFEKAIHRANKKPR